MAILQKHIDMAVNLAMKFGATKLLLFGSALENPAEANDIDLAVAGVDGLEFFILAGEIELMTKIPIDLIPLDGDSDFLSYIQKNSKILI